MEPFTIITPTGDRREVFRFCLRYIERQTVPVPEWIIVDDGGEPLRLPTSIQNIYGLKYVRRERNPADPSHTLPVQLLEALKHVTTDRVLVMEDDDWYRADYCERMMEMFEAHSDAMVLGQGQAVYYHIPLRKCFQMVNRDRASLCQTGFRSAAIEKLTQGIFQHSSDPFVDLHLWRSSGLPHFLLLDVPPMCVGLKGLPGRIPKETMGHWGTARGYKSDPDGFKLRQLIGMEDAVMYEKYYNPSWTMSGVR